MLCCHDFYADQATVLRGALPPPLISTAGSGVYKSNKLTTSAALLGLIQFL